MLICLVAEGFFSGLEIGIVGADHIKVRADAAKGSRGAQVAMKMLAKPEWLLSTTLFGTNIAVVANTTMATAHNRLPVHSGRVDRIVGVLDTLDLLGVDLDQPVQQYVQPVDYVPGSRIIQDVRLDPRCARSSCADPFFPGSGRSSCCCWWRW